MAVITLLASTLLAGCNLASGKDTAEGPGGESSGPSGSTATTPPPPPPVKVTTSLGNKTTQVPVDTLVAVEATDGTLRKVTISAGKTHLAGKVNRAGTRWTATDRLEPGTDYTVRTVAERADGKVRRVSSTFHSQDLTLDQQTYASVVPLAGETVGVGMPVIVRFDVPVTDKATIEKHLHVISSPRQRGSWHWLNDNEVHWRPAKYWKAGTDVTVDVDVNSVPAGDGIYGQEDRHVEFSVGDAMISKVDAETHQMKVFQNGKLLRTIPITTGKPGFTTRSGVKVIIEKFRIKQMNSETIGINPGDPEAYNIDDVEYAMRVTYSGEFVHAAPWSTGYQGYSNVSHGCTGMSTDNAAWLYNLSKVGDVVEYTGTDAYMTLDNGYGDWNMPFKEYAKGSALH